MNKYELGVVVDVRLDEEAQAAELEKIKELVTRLGGEIEKVDVWGKRRLAYEIQKQNEGNFNFITFASKTGVPKEIESRMRIMENVLRFLIIKQEA